MEIGSKAGYYSSKSPKMILHEWCARDKRLKPRYKAIAMDGGRFRCKVTFTKHEAGFPIYAPMDKSFALVEL